MLLESMFVQSIFFFRLLNPVLSRLDKSKAKELKKQLVAEQFDPVNVSLC